MLLAGSTNKVDSVNLNGTVGAAWTTVATEIVITLGSIGALIPRSARAARIVRRAAQADPLGAF